MSNLNLILIVIYIWFIHWIADFILQTDWQAKNKSKNNFALLGHVSSYFVATWVGIVILSFFIKQLQNENLIFMFVILNCVLHFITDYITSRINSYFWNKGETHLFFVGVGADQFCHLTTLLLTFYYIFLR